MARLIYQDDNGLEQTQQLIMGMPPSTLGRDRRCDICVARTSVSRNHAQFTAAGGRFTVQDLGSSNGTYVNGEQIQGPRTLKDGDEVSCGEVVLRFFADAHPEPPAFTSAPPMPPPQQQQQQSFAPAPQQQAYKPQQPTYQQPAYQPPPPPRPPPRTWIGAATPFFPETWPLDGGGMFLSYQYAYSGGQPGLTDGVYIMAPATRLRRHVGGWEESETINAEPDELGTQGIRPLNQEEIKVQGLGERATTLLFQASSGAPLSAQDAETIKAFYNFWFGTNGVIGGWLRERHGAFCRWLTTRDEDRSPLMKKIDEETRRRISQGFEYPQGSGMRFSLSGEAQRNHLGLQLNASLAYYPMSMLTWDDKAAVTIHDEGEAVAFCEAAFACCAGILAQGRSVKAAALAAPDMASAQAGAADYLGGKQAPLLAAPRRQPPSMSSMPASAPAYAAPSYAQIPAQAPAYPQQPQPPAYAPPPPPPQMSAPRTLSSAPQRQPPPVQAPQRLTLIYLNQRIVVDKDSFVIGRAASKSDFTIRDSNISSQHAAVNKRDGVYYIEDLGSTNGVHFRDELIASRAIEEGDVFHLCEHEVTFTYQ